MKYNLGLNSLQTHYILPKIFNQNSSSYYRPLAYVLIVETFSPSLLTKVVSFCMDSGHLHSLKEVIKLL